MMILCAVCFGIICPLAQMVLRIITGKQDLVLTKCETQADMKRVTGARSICLDAYGSDTAGKKYDLEIQRADHGADPHRARYHSSVMDVENLDAGQQFDELPDTYTIFITEKDFFGKKAPIYPIQNMNLVTGEPFNDGAHILYVNGEYRGEDDLGRLMHDFNCTDASQMNFPLMEERTRYLKENEEGVSAMCRVLEEMRDQAMEEGMIEGKIEGKAEGMMLLSALISRLMELGRMEDIARVTVDTEYRDQLLEELLNESDKMK